MTLSDTNYMSSVSDKIARYNQWSGQYYDGFNRKYYTERLNKFLHSKLIKVLVGQRRVGKSYVLRQTITDLIQAGVNPEATLYINMEYREFDFIRHADDLVNLVNERISMLPDDSAFYLFVDEVHAIEEWERAINAFSQDFTRNIFVYISGSNAKLLSGELATLLSGRYVNFLILPFSFDEYCEYQKLPKNKDSFLQYLKTGGMPELFHLPDEESKRQYMMAIYDTVLMRDVVERYHVRDVRLLKDIFAYLANSVSNLTSIYNLVNYFKHQNRKTNYETIAAYVGYLEDAFLIHRCERYDIKGKDVMAGTVKYYLNDLTFKNYLYPGNQHGFGYLLENLVYLKLRNLGYEVYCGHLRNKEVDFVAQKGDELMYLQSAWSIQNEGTHEREYASLLAIRDAYPKTIVSADDLAESSYQGVKNVLFWEFNP
jgi:uncharacterized protein